jgi:xanthine dehydrogenase accessory factor
MNIWWEIASKLQKETIAALLLVVESSIHSPGRQGFIMAVFSDGSLVGTIGGGPMEYSLVNRARELLQRQEKNVALCPQVHRRNEPHSSGMICEGSQLIALCTLESSDSDLIEKISKGEGAYWGIDPDGLFIASQQRQKSYRTFLPGDSWRYTQNFGAPYQLYIIGGGNVGLALSRVAATLDFHVTVIDNRHDLATNGNNTYAHSLRILPYQDLREHIPEGNSVFVVVVTTNAKTDELALASIVGKKLAYLGVMGSKAKIAHLTSTLRAAGFTEENLRQLRAPIGLAIASHTPDEIAISIAAELIQVKNSADTPRYINPYFSC